MVSWGPRASSWGPRRKRSRPWVPVKKIASVGPRKKDRVLGSRAVFSPHDAAQVPTGSPRLFLGSPHRAMSNGAQTGLPPRLALTSAATTACLGSSPTRPAPRVRLTSARTGGAEAPSLGAACRAPTAGLRRLNRRSASRRRARRPRPRWRSCASSCGRGSTCPRSPLPKSASSCGGGRRRARRARPSSSKGALRGGGLYF